MGLFNQNFRIKPADYNRKAQALVLSNKFLFDQDIILYVIPFLKKHPGIEWLQLDSNQIGPDGAKALAEALVEIKTITYLDLSFNKLGPDGAAFFSDNETLQELNLSHNRIGNRGAIALAKNKAWRELWVDANCIDDDGVKALAQNRTLSYLSIEYNFIQDSGRRALALNFGLTVNEGNDKIEILRNAYFYRMAYADFSAGAHNTFSGHPKAKAELPEIADEYPKPCFN